MSEGLTIPRVLGASQASAWFTQWSRAASVPEKVTVVLPSGSLLRPTGIVLLAAGIAERLVAGHPTRIDQYPHGDEESSRHWRYLESIGLFTLGETTNQPVTRRGPSERVVPLRRMTEERIAHELAEASAERLGTELPQIPSSALRMARFVFEELGVNIVQHSERPDTGFGVLQTFENGFEIAFADRGVGFLASLQKNPEFEGRITDDAVALQLALGKGLTGTAAPRQNMGMGLWLLQNFADLLGADLWLASGAALLRRTTLAGHRTTTVHACDPWPGSWICLEAPRVG